MALDKPATPKAATGVIGLDEILEGGLSRGHVFLLEGEPGAGKTTIALQFLSAGVQHKERLLYITLSESEAELRQSAASHGWTLDESIQIFELAPPESLLDSEQQQSLLYSSDLELGETTKTIFETIERLKPDRIVLDSLSELRLLAQSSLRYRRQILALKHYFSRHGATVLMLDDMVEAMSRTVHSVAHGVIRLEQLTPEYGADRRRLRVLKYRGQTYRGGYHDFNITTGGVVVFPRLVAVAHRNKSYGGALTSGLPELDMLLGGGIDAGSSTLLLGPTGAGKSLLGLVFLAAAVKRGDKAALFVFEEELGLLYQRSRGFGIDLERMAQRGEVLVEQVDAAEMSPGEFADRVRRAVDREKVKTVMIDSLTGYQAAMPEEHALILHLHELLIYLNRQGASTFVTLAQHGLMGDMKSPVDLTYLADTLILLRYFEASGEVRRAISVVKKRTGPHEVTIREYKIGAEGLAIGEPLSNFHGVLKGTPTYAGGAAELLEDSGK